MTGSQKDKKCGGLDLRACRSLSNLRDGYFEIVDADLETSEELKERRSSDGDC